MLTVLLHSGVGEIAAVVTRYYGGTKLGTGGLVKAYGGLVQLALESLPVVERVDYVDVVATFGYPAVSAVHQLLPVFETRIVAQDYDVGVRYRLKVPRHNLAAFRAAMADATRGEAIVEESEE
jgi:putative IMPACT (imprinted ancient) family translation regulator